jgi:hypothetical protein
MQSQNMPVGSVSTFYHLSKHIISKNPKIVQKNFICQTHTNFKLVVRSAFRQQNNCQLKIYSNSLAKMVDQEESTPTENANVDADGVSTEDSGANRKANVRAFKRKKKKNPEATATATATTIATTKKSRGKKWMDSRKGMKFTFSSPEEYTEYAAKKSSGDNKASLDKGEKVSEPKAKKSRGMKWMKHQKKKKFSFSSPEEYMEYVGRKSLKKEENASKAAKQLNNNMQTVSETAADVSGGNTLTEIAGNDGATAAWKNDNNNSSNDDDDNDDDDNDDDDNDDDDDDIDDDDIESNKVSTKTENEPDRQRKGCYNRRLTLADAIKVVILWGIIAMVSLIAGRSTGTKNPTNATENPTCSLCSIGTSVHDPDLEIVMADFSCRDEESSCSFQCNDYSRTPIVYTCGEVERLARESSSQCSDAGGGGGDSGSCTELQQAASQCCFSDTD